MEVFLDFLTENYIYFLIAAGVLTLALIGLLVSSKKKGKESVENTEVKNVESTTMNTSNVEPEVAPAPVQPITPVQPQYEPINNQVSEPMFTNNTIQNNIPNIEPIQEKPLVEETLDFGSQNTVNPVPGVQPIQETPATIDTAKVENYDEPIMQIDQTSNNNFQINQNDNNNI